MALFSGMSHVTDLYVHKHMDRAHWESLWVRVRVREKRDILGVQVPKVEFSILHYYDGMHLPNLEDKLCFS